MKTYRLTITMTNGDQASCLGIYSDGFNAVIAAITNTNIRGTFVRLISHLSPDCIVHLSPI